MVSTEKETSHKLKSLALDIRRLYDDIAEFHECCAQLCDTAAPASTRGTPEQTSSIKTLSCWMTERMDSVKRELERIQKKVDAQQNHGA